MSDTVNLLAFGTDVIGSADTGGSGSGGHTIENPSGTDMEQRSNLQFTDAVVADDSTNNRTEISIVRELMQAEFDELTPEEQNRGVIVIKDANPSYLPSDNAVSVTADGVKTYGQLFNELYALTDATKVTRNAKLTMSNTSGGLIYNIERNYGTSITFIKSRNIISDYLVETIWLGPTSTYYLATTEASSTTFTNSTNTVPASGITFTLYYNMVSSANNSSSGGHIIENTNGTDLPQEDSLQFVGVYTEDDSANDRTKVNVVRTMTKAQMNALSSAEKVGFIRTSDEADNPYQGGGGAVDVLIAPTNSITQEITVDLSLYSLLVCSECNSTGKIMYVQSVVAPQQISSGMLTNVNLYEGSTEVDFTFTSSGSARINSITSNTWGTLYGIRK